MLAFGRQELAGALVNGCSPYRVTRYSEVPARFASKEPNPTRPSPNLAGTVPHRDTADTAPSHRRVDDHPMPSSLLTDVVLVWTRGRTTSSQSATWQRDTPRGVRAVQPSGPLSLADLPTKARPSRGICCVLQPGDRSTNKRPGRRVRVIAGPLPPTTLGLAASVRTSRYQPSHVSST